jgi:ABC-type spermidine/putrescine transport system permease subunit II
MSVAFRVMVGLLLLFLLAPLIVVVLMSLSDDAFLAFPRSTGGSAVIAPFLPMTHSGAGLV